MEQLAIESTEFRRTLVSWFQERGRALPWRQTHDPYLVLVSELMLQQTQVQTVLGYFQRWIRRYPTMQSLAAAPLPEVLCSWQGLGYYQRAQKLHQCAKTLVSKYEGSFPQDVDALQKLPGIGQYTAGAIASFAFDKPVPIVDANIARVLSRLFDFSEPIDSSEGKRLLWRWAEKLCRTERPGLLTPL